MKKIIGIVILGLLIINNVSAQDLIGHIGKRGQITLNYQLPTGGTGLVYSVTWNWFYYDGSDSESSPTQKRDAGIQFVLSSTDVKGYAYVDGKQYSKDDVSLVNKQYPKGYSWETHVSRVHFAIKTDYGSSGTHGTLDKSYKHAYDPDFDGFYFVTGKTIASKPLPFPGIGNPQIISYGEGTYELKNVLRLKKNASTNKQTNHSSSSNNQKTTNSTTTLNQAKSNTSVSNPNTTNNTNSSLKENNTAQEKSVASNINLKKNKSVEYSNKGNQFYNNGSYDEAEMYWEKALKLDPNNQAAKNNLDNLKSIQNSNAQIMAQSQQRANNFNAQQQNIQQSSKNIANNLANGSPNAVGQAGVTTAKLLAESGAGYAESMLGGAGVVALGALLNGGGKEPTNFGVTLNFKNGTYIGNTNGEQPTGKGVVTYDDGTILKGTFRKGASGQTFCTGSYQNEKNISHSDKFVVYFKRNSKRLNIPESPYKYVKTHFSPHEISLSKDLGIKHYLKSLFTDVFKTKYDIHYSKISIYKDNWYYRENHFKSGSITNSRGDKVSGNFQLGSIRNDQSTFTWQSNSDSFTCSYNNGKRHGEINFIFNGNKFSTNYNDSGFMQNAIYEGKANFELNFSDLNFKQLEPISNTDAINISRILIVHYEDLILLGETNKAEKLLSEIRKLVKNKSVTKDYSEENLCFFTFESYPAHILNIANNRSADYFWFHLKEFYTNYSQNKYERALKHLFIANKHLNVISTKQRKKLIQYLPVSIATISHQEYSSKIFELRDVTSKQKANQILFNTSKLNLALNITLGKLAYFYEDYKESINLLNTALQIDPSDMDVKKYLGLAFYKNKNYDEAYQHLYQVVDSDWNDSKSIAHLGYTCYNLKKYEEAIKYLERAKQLDSKNNSINYCLIFSYYGTHMYEESYKRSNELLELVGLSEQALYICGSSLCNLHKFSEATAILKKLVKHYPDNCANYYWLGKAHYYAGKIKKSTKAFQKCIIGDKEQSTIYSAFAHCFLKEEQKSLNQLTRIFKDENFDIVSKNILLFQYYSYSNQFDLAVNALKIACNNGYSKDYAIKLSKGTDYQGVINSQPFKEFINSH